MDSMRAWIGASEGLASLQATPGLPLLRVFWPQACSRTSSHGSIFCKVCLRLSSKRYAGGTK